MFLLSAAAAMPLQKIGELAPRAARDIAASDWSIGGETLDRDFASYSAYRNWLGPLGAKAIRFQAGWAKTEQKAGVYDWAWLDQCVADSLAQGVKPWLQVSYGNPLYPGGGGRNIAEAGPTAPEALRAWDEWVRALVKRYRDRVNAWEIWNEPDISKKMSLDEYVALFVRTADIVRAEQPAARIYALSLAHDARYAERFLRAVEARGRLGLVTAITFHGYPHNPDDLKTLHSLQAVVAKFPDAHIELRQGETGAPSEKTTGALRNYEWDETTQAKWDLRRALAHHGEGVPFNLFTLSDFFYPNGRNAKGLLRIDESHNVTKAKLSYRAAQNLFGLFDADLVRASALISSAAADGRALQAYRSQKSGRPVYVYWENGEPPKAAEDWHTTTFSVKTTGMTDPVCVDLKTGEVFALSPTSVVSSADETTFRAVPIYDSPIVIASRHDLRLQ